jgi:tRNA nucleotidyltransferase (CCA-adding enzyme)
LISHLRLTKPQAKTLRDTNSLKDKLESLADPKLTPSRIYSLLHDYSTPAIIANESASDSPITRRHLQLFLDKLRYVKPILNGNDLLKIGIAPGPHLKEILNRLHEARLDGKVANRKDEEDLVKGWLDKEK